MKTILRNEVAFTASLPDAPMPYSDISAMIIGMKMAGTCTLVQLLTTLSELGIKDSDEVLDGLSIDGADLLAISCLFAGITPEEMGPGVNSASRLYLGPLVLPLNLPGLAQGIVPSYHINQTAQGSCETETIVVGIEHGISIGKRFHYSKKNDTASTTGTELDMSKPNKNMVALLMYATTIPTLASVTRSIKEIKVLIAGKEEYHFNWYELGYGKSMKTTFDDVHFGVELDNYRIIIFPEGGIPANALTVWTVSDTATDTIEFIGIYQ